VKRKGSDELNSIARALQAAMPSSWQEYDVLYRREWVDDDAKSGSSKGGHIIHFGRDKAGAERKLKELRSFGLHAKILISTVRYV
jgi:hypothetical protein